jgi:[ribosomal protein S5]-alanine N-acetyltransferase
MIIIPEQHYMHPLRFTLRDFTINDIDSVAENANNIKISENLRDRFPYPYLRQDAEEFITIIASSDQSKIFAIDVDGNAIGAIGLITQGDIYKKTVELGYWIGEKYWNKGIISGAIKEVVDYTFDNYDIVKIFAKVFDKNAASAKALEKNGFILEARLKNQIYKSGVFLDELVYSKFRGRKE